MKISAQNYEYVCVLTLSGECTADDVDQFNRVVNDRLEAGSKHFLIDCEHLEFVDSAGLECWLRLQERISERGGQLRLIKPDENLSTVLRITRLDRAFKAHPSLEAAVRSVR
ncbi:MAG: anti-sigma factor antagonist [Planctomycetota bacterium]|nr:MAG: anti-sigma factor antagonist [Planctomycetota bacterium]